METKWIRHLGLVGLVACLTLGSSQVFAQGGGKVQSITVDVEVPIESGDAASAIEKATQEALKKAVELSLPGSLSEDEKKKRLSSPSSYVKSFKPLEQFEQGGKLKLKMLAEVMVDELAPSSLPTTSSGAIRTEWVWRPNAKALSILELRRILEKDFQATVGMQRLQYGSLILELISAQDPEVLMRGLAERFGRVAMIRKVTESTPSPSEFSPLSP